MSDQPKYQEYLVPAEKQHNLNDAGHGFKFAQYLCRKINISEAEAKEAVSLYDKAGETIEQYLVEQNCFVALTDQFKFTLHLHDDCEDVISVEPLNVH
jgi:hypothetical protein